jgi:glycosyltransferase involved in cell wall biosynthesis
MLVSHGATFGGGGELAFDELVRGLREHAPSVALLVVSPAEGVIAERARSYGADVAIIAQPRWADFGNCNTRYWIQNLLVGSVTLLQTVRLIRTWRPDVVITNTLTIPVPAIAAKLCRVRHIWMVNEFGNRDHDLAFLLGYRRTVAAIGRLSDVVACCSGAVREELAEQGISKSKLVVAYGAVNTPEAGTSVGHRRSKEQLVALMVGRIAEPKGQLLAVRAVGVAVRAGADVKLRLVGDHYDPQYVAKVEEAIREEELVDRVELNGALQDPFPAYRHADVFLMCSRNEAFGRVTVEAMKFGLPVIGINSGGTRELIDNGKTGFLVESGDIAGMAEKLVSFWADEECRATMGSCAQGAAVRVFTAAGWVHQVLSVKSGP